MDMSVRRYSLECLVLAATFETPSQCDATPIEHLCSSQKLPLQCSPALQLPVPAWAGRTRRPQLAQYATGIRSTLEHVLGRSP